MTWADAVRRPRRQACGSRVSLRRARRSGDPIAAATCPPQRAIAAFVSVMAVAGVARTLRGRRCNGCAAAPKRAQDARRSVLGWAQIAGTGTRDAKRALADCPMRRKARCPKGNGGRHCCQPPLRRAKDLPVFVTWSKTRRPRTRSRSWLTSSGVASHRTAPSCEEPDRSTRLRGPKVRWSFDPSGLALDETEVPAKTVRCSAALLGTTTLASRFAHRNSEELREPRRARGRSTLPAPLPGWPRYRTRKLFPLPAGGDRSFGHLPHLLAVAGFLGRPGPPSRSPDAPCTSSSELRKRKMR